MTFVEFMCKIINEKGYTKAGFADKIGVTYKTVLQWERGIQSPPIDRAREIVAMFGYEVEIVPLGNITPEESESLQKAIKALEPCEDCNTRKMLEEDIDPTNCPFECGVKQEPKQGHWIIDVDNNRHWDKRRFYCSECGHWQTYGETDYCPKCGSRMIGGAE